MANQRSIGEFDEPSTRAVNLGIIPPTIDNDDFEIKSSMLSLVERATYKGHSVECPLEHLDRFERLCSRTLKVNGVPQDTLKMILFPFSLEDKAAYWERNVPSEKVSNWADVKTEFLRKFFPTQKTARFRIEIQSFKQSGDESFSEAWDRLKGLTRSCPHHGVSKESLFGIFYRGVNNGIRRSLDTASNGSFASLTCDQAETLIENLAQSDACYGSEYDSSSFGVDISMSDGKFRELNERIDKLAQTLGNVKRHVSFVDDQNQVATQEACRGGSNDQSMGNQERCSYINGYNRPFNHCHPPPHQPSYPQPQGSSHDNETKAMFQQIMDSLTRNQLQQAEFQKEVQRRLDGMQAEIEWVKCQNTQASSSSKQPMVSFPSQSEMNPRTQCNAITLRSGKELQDADKEVTEPKEDDPRENEDDKVVVPKPKVKGSLDSIDEKTKVEARTIESSTKVKILIKHPHPGRFIVPCSIDGHYIADALCDSGSFVNVISLDMAKRFGLSEMQPNSTIITFGDASRKQAVGIIENCSILVRTTFVPTDFLVIDMVSAREQPIILGSPFLATVGAQLDYVTQTAVFKNVDSEYLYNIRPSLSDYLGDISRPPPSIDASPSLESSNFLETIVLDDDEPPLASNLMVLALDGVENDEPNLLRKKSKRHKPKKKPRDQTTRPPLTLKPLHLSEGKLERKVGCKGANKPFHKARILFPSDRGPNDTVMIPEKMALAFGITTVDRGPYHEVPLHFPI